jgi:hypothetical protein
LKRTFFNIFSAPLLKQAMATEVPSSIEEKTPEAVAASPEVASLLVIDQKYADETLQLVEQYDSTFGPPTPEFEKKLRWKLYLHITVLITVVNLMLFVSIAVRSELICIPNEKFSRLIKLLCHMRQSWGYLKKLV